MSKRVELRERYLQGWYQMDAELLLTSTAENFIFDDPVEPEPVSRDMLGAYMLRWDKRMQALGADNHWDLTHEIREDRDGILTDWEWWQVSGTGIVGNLTGTKLTLLPSMTTSWAAWLHIRALWSPRVSPFLYCRSFAAISVADCPAMAGPIPPSPFGP